MTLVVLEAVAKSECVDQLEALFKGAVPDTRAYDGCQQITVSINENGRTFLIVSQWDSKQHYRNYHTWRTGTGVLERLANLLESGPSIRVFDVVDT